MREKSEAKYESPVLRLLKMLRIGGIALLCVCISLIIAACVIRYKGVWLKDVLGTEQLAAAAEKVPLTSSLPASVQADAQTSMTMPEPTQTLMPKPMQTPAASPKPTPKPTSKPKPTHKSKPSDADLYAIGSKIRYPKNESYLSDYKYGSINSPWGSDVSVYSFYYAEPMKNNKRNIDLPHGTGVKVLAEENGFACVIVSSLAQACWVNAKYIDYR